MSHDTSVSRTVYFDGAERRYETIQYESDLFSVTLFEDDQPAGPEDYLRSAEAAEELGEQWLNPDWGR